MHRPVALLLATAAFCGCFLAARACWPRERDALLAFKQGIHDTADVLASWQKGRQQDCCHWRGVACSNKTGHVTELDLGYTRLVGQISPSLLSLEHLEYLNLSNTFLLGRAFPEFLTSLHRLSHLGLSHTPLSGKVPAQLANLSNLQHLDLSSTSLHGRAPEFLFSYKNMRHLDLSQTLLSGRLPRQQLANSSKSIEYLDLSGTFLSGMILPQLGNLSNLRYLGLGFTQDTHTSDVSWLSRLRFLEYLNMSGIDLSTADVFLVANEIPSLKALILVSCSLPNANQMFTHLNLTKLEQLHLARNHLGHPIGTCWFWNKTSIKDLDLRETHLYGPFPAPLGGMTCLQRLDFSYNGNSATMTVDLKNLCDLEELWLSGSLKSGNITEFVRKLPQCSPNKLFFLSLRDNNMTGMLPDTMVHLNGLRYLFLSNNSITGAIPPGLTNLTSLEMVDLCLNQLTGQIPMLPRSLIAVGFSKNNLSGPLPLDFGAPDLAQLSLSSNYLTGHVPRAICELKHLVTLDLSNNLLEGEFPLCSAMPIMEFLILSNNNFSGSFPSWLQNSSNLVFLDLAVNKFYGMLPVWIGELAKLRFMQLNRNMFYGDIPVSITNLKLLQHFSLASNNLSGSIPSSLSKLIAMSREHPPRLGSNNYVKGDTNKDILSVVMKQQEHMYVTSEVNEMVGIDLSLNHLTGGIPAGITSLNGLLNLNLSWNHLSGNIPVKIGDMKSLESLDLSRNNICGEIPTSMSDLTYLSSLDLSYNNLAGIIPTGRQLDTLYTDNPSMYNGNIGLCGPPLEKNFPCNIASENGNYQGSENVYDPVLFFYFGLAAGFVVGLWVVLCAILFKKAWRNAYFRVFNKLCDNVYVFVVLTGRKITSKATTNFAREKGNYNLTGVQNQIRPI